MGLLGDFRGWLIQWNHVQCCGLTLVAVAMIFGLGAEIQSPTSLYSLKFAVLKLCLLVFVIFGCSRMLIFTTVYIVLLYSRTILVHRCHHLFRCSRHSVNHGVTVPLRYVMCTLTNRFFSRFDFICMHGRTRPASGCNLLYVLFTAEI